jgi:enoyl-CoA hydratase
VPYTSIQYAVEGGVAVLTIDRPQALNALNSIVLSEMEAALRAFHADPEARVLVLTGAGDKAFIAGADISEMVAMTPEQALHFARRGQGVARLLAGGDKVSIAAVGGFALGGGCEMAMACDVLIAADNARFGQPEVKLGTIPGFGGTQRLTRLVGPQRARYLVLTGEMIQAPEAMALGLVSKVVAKGQALVEAKRLAALIATKAGPLAVAKAKAVINRGAELPLDAALELEAEAFSEMFATGDLRLGMQAFMDKRAAEFRGE